MKSNNYNLKVRFPENKFTDILIIFPGISGGQDNILIQNLCKIAIRESFAVVTWDFGFFLSEGEIDKDKEVHELEEVIAYIKDRYPMSTIHLAGKSYGGLISSLVNPSLFDSLCVFGLLKEFKGIQFGRIIDKPLLVIHGTRDKFFSIEEVKQYLGSEKNLFIVEDGDHGLGDKDFNFIGQNSLEWYIRKLKLYIS